MVLAGTLKSFRLSGNQIWPQWISWEGGLPICKRGGGQTIFGQGKPSSIPLSSLFEEKSVYFLGVLMRKFDKVC